ncbi:uncharacterized protein LOC141850574 isoform X2 [Brevipalpus obovatus]|uniref:uncharacterized protein LOC141850574 isoform X2 n=1 Tax=Brevipalpus obovatus TaxID=246614 RepID=UPI003D9DE9D4
MIEVSIAKNGITGEQLIMKNREMNNKNPCDEILFWWYFKRRTNFRHLPKSGVEKTLESFLNEGMDCLPSFSFVRVDHCFHHHLIEEISFGYPTIGLSQDIQNEPKLDDEIFKTSVHALLGTPKECCISEGIFSFIVPHIEAIHINRFASDHKVIITDWSDPESIKPDLEDPEYPVKAFVYFVKELSGHSMDIIEFVSGFDFPVMRAPMDEGYLLYWNPSKDRLIRQPSGISLAFAGKQVLSSIQCFRELSNESDLTQEVTKFKNSIKFPTNDGRVLGFVIHSYGKSRIEEFSSILMKTFESVKFVNLQMLVDHDADFQILLILIQFRFTWMHK